LLANFLESLKMKKSILYLGIISAVAASFTPSLVYAEAGDWVVRARVVNVSPNDDSKLGTTVNQNVANEMSPGAELNVSDKVIPELDISYYFTKNIAAELILAVGTRHNVNIQGDALATIGNQGLGSVNLLPPTLTAQWHFNPDQTIDPYIGAGINYTAFLDRNLIIKSNALAGTKIKVDSDSWGPALQAGFDINLKDGWLINADVKYVWLDTDVKLNTPAGAWTKIDSLDINPWVVGIGIGKKF
jgi:outer membrane protein